MRNRTQVVIPAMRRGQAIGRDCSRGIVLDADALQGERPYKTDTRMWKLKCRLLLPGACEPRLALLGARA